jgi:hypothetical protein
MSTDDQKLMQWITNHMSHIGYPAMMIIMGDDSKNEIYNKA